MEAFLASLLSGVAGKLGAAQTIAEVAPAVVGGVIKSAADIPAAINAFEALASDVGSGKWSNAGKDVSAALSAGEKLVSDFGVNLPKLNALPKKLAKPAITTGETVQMVQAS